MNRKTRETIAQVIRLQEWSRNDYELCRSAFDPGNHRSMQRIAADTSRRMRQQLFKLIDMTRNKRYGPSTEPE